MTSSREKAESRGSQPWLLSTLVTYKKALGELLKIHHT
jgi:hypothetical protein